MINEAPQTRELDRNFIIQFLLKDRIQHEDFEILLYVYTSGVVRSLQMVDRADRKSK